MPKKTSVPYRVSFRAARVNVDLTIKEAALKIGIDPSTLQKYETGKSRPDWDIVNKMVEEYKVPIDHLKM